MDISGEENIGYRFPINKNNFDAWLENYLSGVWNVEIDGNRIPNPNMMDIDAIKKTVADFSDITIDNYDVMQIINNGMAPYIESDTKTFDECYDETVNKLNLYINE